MVMLIVLATCKQPGKQNLSSMQIRRREELGPYPTQPNS